MLVGNHDIHIRVLVSDSMLSWSLKSAMNCLLYRTYIAAIRYKARIYAPYPRHAKVLPADNHHSSTYFIKQAQSKDCM